MSKDTIHIAGIAFNKIGNKAWKSDELPNLDGKFFIIRESKKHGYVLSLRKRKGGAVYKEHQMGTDMDKVVVAGIEYIITKSNEQILAKRAMIDAAEEIRRTLKC
jgi:hypothetical protein